MLKCIIVDEQPQSVQSLKNFIKKTPFLEFSGAFKDAREALAILKTEPADLIFMDIRKSIQAASAAFQLFQQNAQVVLMSSNRKFAFYAIEYQAIDFLLKPLIFQRFYSAAEKAYSKKFPTAITASNAPQSMVKGGYIFIKEGTRLVRIDLDDIYYVMGLKNYVSIFTKSQRIVSLLTMKEMEELLPSHRFIRVHRSYFIALDKIISVEKQHIHLKDKIIPIGNIYLSVFMQKIMGLTNQ